MSSEAKEILSQAIVSKGILRSRDQRLIGPKGDNNLWLIDMRRLLTEARCLNAVADLFWASFAGKGPFQVGGLEVGAIPIVSAILMKGVSHGRMVNGFIVRKERKTYGAGNLIEGTVTDEPIVIVDDLINSGNSLEKVRVVLGQLNKKIFLVFVLIDYQSERGMLWRAKYQIPVAAPFLLSQFGLSVKKSEPPPLPQIFRKVWRFTSPDPNFFHRVPKSFPATDGKRIYFGSDSGIFWCLDAQNGKMAWNFKVHSKGHKNLWSAPALHEGKVFFGSYDGNVYCLDAVTGKEIWRYMGADWVGSSPEIAPELGLLFIGLEFAVEGKRGSIIALSLKNGERIWEHPTKRYTHASPAYWAEKKLVACGSNDNEMFLFDAQTGTLKWRFETRGETEKGSIRHAPAFDKKRGYVVTGCADGIIYVVDVETGKEVFSVQTGNTIYTVPLVVGDLAFVGSTDKYLYVLNLEKREVQRRIFAGSKVFGPPRLLEGKVYFGACSGLIYELDPSTANVTGTHQLPDSITNALTYSAETGLFYALTYVNQLFAMSRLPKVDS